MSLLLEILRGGGGGQGDEESGGREKGRNGVAQNNNSGVGNGRTFSAADAGEMSKVRKVFLAVSVGLGNGCHIPWKKTVQVLLHVCFSLHGLGPPDVPAAGLLPHRG